MLELLRKCTTNGARSKAQNLSERLAAARTEVEAADHALGAAAFAADHDNDPTLAEARTRADKARCRLGELEAADRIAAEAVRATEQRARERDRRAARAAAESAKERTAKAAADLDAALAQLGAAYDALHEAQADETDARRAADLPRAPRVLPGTRGEWARLASAPTLALDLRRSMRGSLPPTNRHARSLAKQLAA